MHEPGLDYEIESDEDWSEPEDGESLTVSSCLITIVIISLLFEQIVSMAKINLTMVNIADNQSSFI